MPPPWAKAASALKGPPYPGPFIAGEDGRQHLSPVMGAMDVPGTEHGLSSSSNRLHTNIGAYPTQPKFPELSVSRITRCTHRALGVPAFQALRAGQPIGLKAAIGVGANRRLVRPSPPDDTLMAESWASRPASLYLISGQTAVYSLVAQGRTADATRCDRYDSPPDGWGHLGQPYRLIRLAGYQQSGVGRDGAAAELQVHATVDAGRYVFLSRSESCIIDGSPA